LNVPPALRPSILRFPRPGFFLEGTARLFCGGQNPQDTPNPHANAQIREGSAAAPRWSAPTARRQPSDVVGAPSAATPYRPPSAGEAIGTGRPVTKSTSSNALKRLQDADLVIKFEHGMYQIQDDALAEWLRKQEVDG
jgi:hypothetical protein